jgi:hypothetical protein
MRRLTLKSETLSSLTADELAGVVGGIPPITENNTLCHECNIPTNGCTQRVTQQTCTW